MLSRNSKNIALLLYTAISFLIGLFFAYKLLSIRSGFISENSSYATMAPKFLIPFSGIDIQYAILFIFVFILIISLFITMEEFSNDKKILFALLPMRYSDIVFAKLLIISKNILLIAFSLSLPYIIGYGGKVFALLKPIFFTGEFTLLILLYIVMFSLYIAFISIIAVMLSFIFVIILELIPSVPNRPKLYGSSVWLNIIIAGIAGVFVFEVRNALSISSNRYLEKIYGSPPISYISRAIVDITRPAPCISYPVNIVFLLIATAVVLLIVVFGLSLVANKGYWACTQDSHKTTKNLQESKPEEFSIIKNLPIFIKKEMYAFLRKGNIFKWLLSSFVLAIIIPLIFYVPAMLSKEVSAKLTYVMFGIKINYLALFILIISLAQFSQIAFYVFYSDENDVFLLKVTSVNVKKYLLEKLLAAAIISVIPLSVITGVTFSFFVDTQHMYYIYMAVVQFLALFFWDFTSNFYIGGTKITGSKITFWQLKSGSLSNYLTISSLIILAVWFGIYKFILGIPYILAICVVTMELILPILVFGRILKRIENAIEKVDLCKSA